jgi:hypothetical protein
MEPKYYSVVETAQLVRACLKKNFPGIIFSVTSKSYSGGASIDVRWVLGPTECEVDAYLNLYESEGFDGGIDMAYCKDHWMSPDGTVTLRSSQGSTGSGGYSSPEDNPAPSGAVPVTFGSHYVHGSRRYDADHLIASKFYEQVAIDMCKLQGVPYTGTNTRGLYGPGDDNWVSHHVNNLLSNTSFKPGENYAGVRYMTTEERENSMFSDNRTDMMIIKSIPPEKSAASPEEESVEIALSEITLSENKEKSGLELRFPSKPSALTINTLKSNGWRWSHRNTCWYTSNSPDALEFAQNLIKGVI